MALSSGFFNSISGDRVYNADQISSMFEGLISDGIYESVGDAYQVTATGGMSVNVGTGRAMVASKWAKNTSPITVNISAAHVLLPRYTAVVLRLDITGRTISVETIDGTAASTPEKPAIVRSASYYDLLLAYVYVAGGATAITQADIEDTRTNTDVCGWVTGIITQVDTSTLFLQYETAYEAFYEQMQAWKATEQTAFEEWFDTLTQDLQVNTYINKYRKTVSLAYGDSTDIPLDFDGYGYDAHDVIIVAFNGLTAVQGTDYTIDATVTPAEINVNMSLAQGVTQDVDILVLKSKIGDPVMQPLTTVVEAINSMNRVGTDVTVE